MNGFSDLSPPSDLIAAACRTKNAAASAAARPPLVLRMHHV